MTVVLGALVVAGRILLVLLVLVLAAAAVLLLIPVGLAVRWTPASGVTVGAYAGPLHRLLFPRRHRKKKKPKKEKTSAALPAQEPVRPQPAAAAEASRPEPGPGKAPSPPPPPPEPGKAPSAPAGESEPPLPPIGPQADELSSGEQNALLGAARIFFGALAPYRARLLRGVQVNRLQVFWTVTGEDAADTAVAYGRRMALINNLLTLARQYLTIRAQSLRMEPDFTGTMAAKRIFSCQIRTRPYIILMILFYLMRRDKQGRSPLEQIQEKLAALS